MHRGRARCSSAIDYCLWASGAHMADLSGFSHNFWPHGRLRTEVLMQTNLAFTAGTDNRAAGQNASYNVIGFDDVNTISGKPAPYCRDDGNGVIRLCTAFDANGAPSTWSNAKTIPTGTSWFNIVRVLTFKSNLYLMTVIDASSRVGIYKATPTSGNNALTWTLVLTATAGATTRPVCMTYDATYIYYTDYGDPSGGPQVYRSADGDTWGSIATFAGIRHAHAIAADPYTAGNVWLCLGDGVAFPNRYSTDYGATWNNLPGLSGTHPQLTDISFTQDEVWFADDTAYVTSVVVDKATKTWKGASLGFHGNVAHPGKMVAATWNAPGTIASGTPASTNVTLTGARVGHTATATITPALPAGLSIQPHVVANDQVRVDIVNETGSNITVNSGNAVTVIVRLFGGPFAPTVFYGAVDPASGVFYCVTQQQTQTPDVGLFAILDKGAPPMLLDFGPYGNYGVFISGGRVYYGNKNRAALTTVR